SSSTRRSWYAPSRWRAAGTCAGRPEPGYPGAVAATDMISAMQRRYQRFFGTRPPVPFAVAPAAGGPAHAFGTGEPAFTIPVRDPRGARALAGLDQFQVAVAYLNGWLDVDGDVATALKMRTFFRDVHPIAWLSQFAPALIRGRREHDRRSISHHYDEDSEFF